MSRKNWKCFLKEIFLCVADLTISLVSYTAVALIEIIEEIVNKPDQWALNILGPSPIPGRVRV